MTDTHDDTEARRLIETALGTPDTLAALAHRRHEDAIGAFIDAAEAYERLDSETATDALHRYAGADSLTDEQVYDLAAAGAMTIATLLSTFPSGAAALTLDPASPHLLASAAIQAVNCAAADRPDVLTQTLDSVHDNLGGEGMRWLASVLFDLHREVRELGRGSA